MRRFKIIQITFLFLVTSYSTVFAQQVEVGANLGGAGYMGDLNQYNPIKISGLAAGAFVKLNFNPHLGLGLHYHIGKIKGDDASSSDQQLRDRNLSFTSPLNELSLLLDFNLFNLYAFDRKTRITPFLFAGVGQVFFNPKAVYQGDTYQLRNFLTEGQSSPYKKYALTIPYGAGVKYKLKSNWTLYSQIGYRTPFTDYLDDVRGVYAPSSAWDTSSNGLVSRALADRSGENTGVYLGDPGSQRGDFRKRDTYLFVGIGISYTFVSQKCFTF